MLIDVNGAITQLAEVNVDSTLFLLKGSVGLKDCAKLRLDSLMRVFLMERLLRPQPCSPTKAQKGITSVGS